MKTHFLSYKRFLALIVALGMGMGTAFAEYDFLATCETGQTLYYNIIDAYNEYVEIVAPAYGNTDPWYGFTKPTGPITLPSSVYHNETNYTVVAIGASAFSNCYGLTGSLTIPNTVVSLADHAFFGCSGFDGVLTIPSSVASMGISVFMSSNHFTHVIYNAANCADMTPNAQPFYGMQCPILIGDAVQRIPAYLFYNGDITGSLTIPDNVATIGQYAFRYCDGLSELILGDGVVSIDNGAFYKCTG